MTRNFCWNSGAGSARPATAIEAALLSRTPEPAHTRARAPEPAQLERVQAASQALLSPRS
jgi:hypothetical protein